MKRLVIGVAMMAVLGAATAAWAQDKTVQTARKLLADKADSLVRVSAVVKTEGMAMGIQLGHGDEQEREALGTVIDKSGLTVVSYSSLDPMSVTARAIKIRKGGEGQELKIKTELSEVKIRLADGTELPATIVLKDADLDLAFVLPKPGEEATKNAKFTPVDLGESATAGVLDEVILLGRAGQSLDFQPSVNIERIASIVKKPRAFFVVRGSLGGPVFTAEGKLLGITVMLIGAKGGGLAAMSTVTVPAKDVQELAQQALTKKPAEEKK